MRLPCSRLRLSADRWGKCQWGEHLDNRAWNLIAHTRVQPACVCKCVSVSVCVLRASAECRGYKGVFVKARATPVFSQTFGLGVYGELKRCLSTEAPPIHLLMDTHAHTHTCTHTRHLTNGARYKMLGNLFMCMCVSTWLYSTWLYEYITVRWARVERRGFLLRDLLNFAVQLAGGGLVEFDAVGQTACLDGVQQTKCSNSIHVSSVFSQIEGDLGKKERREEYIQKHW